jgi:signal transduction histidine kinase
MIFMNVSEYLKKQSSRPLIIVSGLILVLLIGTADYLTGEELSISIFYLLPIIFVAWFTNTKSGVFMSIVSIAIWHIAGFMIGQTYSHSLILYWNSIVQLGFFLIIVLISSALKTEYEKKTNLINKLNDTLAELKQSEEELKQRTKELSESNAELERFAYVAAHDLKGPLLAVEGFIQRLKRRHKDKLDSDAETIIGYAVDGVTRMRTLINDLLAYAKVGTKKDPFKLASVNNIIERALSNIQTDIEEKGAVVTCDVLPDILTDEVQMTQLFQNLIGNGIKFCKDRAPRINISAEQKNNEWVFSVRDNGIGIDKKDADRIFDIFQRLHSTAQYPGTGIGLAICKKIAERLGGRIWVESEPGKGSAFNFTIPQYNP